MEALEITPEAEVFETAASLIAVQHAVALAFGGRISTFDPKAFRDTVKSVFQILRSIDGAYGVIVGGLAVQHHGYKRFTQDIDIIVNKAHFRRIVDKLQAGGFTLDPGYFFISDSGIRVELMREGARLASAAEDLPHPSALGKNGWFADLPALIHLKLQSKRLQDLADVVALIRTHQLKKHDIAATLPARHQAQFEDLAAQAKKEIDATLPNARASFDNLE